LREGHADHFFFGKTVALLAQYFPGFGMVVGDEADHREVMGINMKVILSDERARRQRVLASNSNQRSWCGVLFCAKVG